MDAESYYNDDSRFLEDMERRVIEQHYVNKVVGHEPLADDDGQTKLFD